MTDALTAGAPEGEPVAYVPRAHSDSYYTVKGEYKWNELSESSFQVADPTIWECAPLYAAPIAPTQGKDAQDAKRYRWLRDLQRDWDAFDAHWLSENDLYGQGPDEMDAHIDDAIAAMEGGKSS
jgi:hypothetical protein